MEDAAEHLLAIVLDTNLTSVVAEGGDAGAVLDSILAFCNAHLMASTSNLLCLTAAHVHENRVLFPPEADDGQPAQAHYELFSQSSAGIVRELKAMMEAAPPEPQTSAPMAAGLAMSLCFINRVSRERLPHSRLQKRVLIVSGQGTVSAQYMDLMNVFFTAQKLEIQVDACVLGAESGVLQQGADITGGVCLRVPQWRGLLQYLLWVFLPFGDQRQKLALPEPPVVDYRAACFCHRQLVSVGFVCSVCLSIFCKFAPICSTCHTVFKVKGMSLPKPTKRKRAKQGL